MNPKNLTPADVPALTGDDLDRAVEWWVYGVSPRWSGRVMDQDGAMYGGYYERGRPFHADANLCLQWWDLGGALEHAEYSTNHTWKERAHFVELGSILGKGETFQLAACRAAILACMRNGERKTDEHIHEGAR